MKKYLAPFINGLIKENPVLVMLIGMCPTLAVTTSAINGLGMGLSTTLVLFCSNIIISLLRKVIPDGVRIPAFIVVVASLVTIVGFVLEGFIPSLYESLGIYISLIVVNCIILGRAESFASKNPVGLSALDGLGMGLGFTWALGVIGLIREFLGAGQAFGIQVLPLAEDSAKITAGFTPITIFVLAPGAFFVLAIVVAVMNFIRQKAEEKGRPLPMPSGCMGGDCAACASGVCASEIFLTGTDKADAKKEDAAPAAEKKEAVKADAAAAKSTEQEANK